MMAFTPDDWNALSADEKDKIQRLAARIEDPNIGWPGPSDDDAESEDDDRGA